jgi:hypothetical protein
LSNKRADCHSSEILTIQAENAQVCEEAQRSPRRLICNETRTREMGSSEWGAITAVAIETSGVYAGAVL